MTQRTRAISDRLSQDVAFEGADCILSSQRIVASESAATQTSWKNPDRAYSDAESPVVFAMTSAPPKSE